MAILVRKSERSKGNDCVQKYKNGWKNGKFIHSYQSVHVGGD
jgi:hypothetical protein